MHGHVGAGAHRNAHIGRRQGGRVVDAVADHRHFGTSRFEPLHDAGFVLGQHICIDLGDAHRKCCCVGAAFVVAGDEHAADAHFFQRSHCRGGAGFGGIAEGQQAQHGGFVCVIDLGQPRHGAALRLPLRGLVVQRRRVGLQLGEIAAAAQVQRAARHAGLHTAPWHRANVGGRLDLQSLSLRGARHR